jgi:hypothetical protein
MGRASKGLYVCALMGMIFLWVGIAIKGLGILWWIVLRCMYLFSPRKSLPTPIGHLGEGAHKVSIYDSTLFPIILYHHIREFH